jgi:cytochrome c oxidase cbb3-type subunit I/II
LGIVFYASALYWAGMAQSLMWKQFTPLGTLQYPNFLETLLQIQPMYVIRAIGGLLYLGGMILLVVNLVKTARQGTFARNEDAEAPPIHDHASIGKEFRHRWIERRPVQFALVALVVILIGGIIEIVPTYIIKSNIPTIASVKPYTPLELHGRDLYIREG